MATLRLQPPQQFPWSYPWRSEDRRHPPPHPAPHLPPHLPPHPPMPTEWRVARSWDGLTYYHNLRTRETTWQRPMELEPPPPFATPPTPATQAQPHGTH